MKYSVALSGSYCGGRVEDLFKDLTMEGILHISLVGREVTLQVSSENLEEIKDRLSGLGINNISVLEWKKTGITVSEPGKGKDSDKILKVSLIPSVRGSGINQLAVISEFEIDEETRDAISYRVEEILEDAGVTDALYTVDILKEGEKEEYLSSAAVATLNALFNAGGVVSFD